MQGLFADHEVGELTVPGALTPNPRPETRPFPGAEKALGEIRPPLDVVAPAALASPLASPLPESRSFPWWVPVLVLLGVGGLGLTLRRRTRRK